MRRPLITFIAGFVVLGALASASAQRGGVRSSGGGNGVAVGRPSGGHTFSGMHTGPSARSSFRGEGFHGVRIRTGSFHHCNGCRFRNGYPLYGGYGYAGYYDPFWWWDSSSSYNYDEERTRELALASEMNTQSIEEQRLRERENWDRERDQDTYARRPQARARKNIQRQFRRRCWCSAINISRKFATTRSPAKRFGCSTSRPRRRFHLPTSILLPLSG
jgi:hypothetical protein